jgi:hypothetical protein
MTIRQKVKNICSVVLDIKVKGIISLIMTFILIVSIFQITTILNTAATKVITWRKNDVMDINLNVIRNKAGTDDVFFQMDVEAAGLYTLEYFLEDGRKTTVTFENTFERLNIKFKVQQFDPMTPGTPIEKTQDLMDLSYLDIDYSQQIPTWKFNGTKEVDPVSNTLDFSIIRSASARFPGIAFQMDNKKFLAKWDFQSNQLYVFFDGYVAGQIMPVTFTTPKLITQTIKVLKSLEDFIVSPTYLVIDPINPTQNKEVSPVVSPNSNNDRPGNRPGLKYTFKQPKELNLTTWGYTYDVNSGILDKVRAVFQVADIGSTAYLDFNLLLSINGDKRIYEIPSENGDQNVLINQVKYTFDAATHTFEINIVKDKSTLVKQDEIIEWNGLESSRIYNTSIGFQFEEILPEYEFATFVPVSNFAYTYLEYQLRRSNQQEAFIQIQPYKVGTNDEIEYIVLYSKIIAPTLDPVNDLWLKHYQSNEDSGTTINIPVPFRANSYQDAYQVLVNFSNTELTSQVLNYRAIDDLNVPPSTPTIKSIDNVFVIPSSDGISQNPSKIQFDMTWSALENRVSGEFDSVFINGDGDPTNDRIYYEVLVNDIPDLSQVNPFQVVRVYEIYQDQIDGRYKLMVHGDTTAIDSPSAKPNYTAGYNSLDELLRMEKIVIYKNDLWTSRIDTVLDEDLDTYLVTERTPITNPLNYQANFEYPGVNYVRIRAITKRDGLVGTSSYSVPTSLSLSMLTYEIPIVEGITYNPFYSLVATEPMGIVLDWPAIDISNYENNMLLPVDKEVEELAYRVFISADKDSILNLNPDNSHYTEIAPTPGGDVTINEAQLQLLRTEDSEGNGNVVYFDLTRPRSSSADVSTRIEGLDLNNNYYVRIVVNAKVYDLINGTYEYRRGKPSSILEVTTPIVPPEPGDNEILPLAPENLVIDFYDDSLLTTTIEWTIPGQTTVELNTYGFEVLSIEDFRLPTRLSLKDKNVIDSINDPSLSSFKTEVWRVFYEGTDVVLKKYNKTTQQWEVQDFALLKVSDKGIRIIDDSNSPNRVNYYYVRTMSIRNGSPLKTSNWVPGTITTSPVKGPINLVVDYNSGFTYNPKYEVIVRFDAPIPDNAVINTDYRMEIFIKSETDLDYIMATPINAPTTNATTYSAQYLKKQEGPIGYQRLTYQLSGLKSGKQYFIKVRIEDRTKLIEILPDGSQSYPKSPFSDRISTRTEFDQTDYDKEAKYKQYIDYYFKVINERKQKPYFDLKSSVDLGTAKYRQTYIDGFLELNQNRQYNLVAYNKKSSVYYLPSEMLKVGNDLTITYAVESKSQLIALKPYSIGMGITKEINNVKTLIQSYNSNLEDYYIQILLSVGDYNGTINNLAPSSPVVNIQMNVIPSKISEDELDIYLENAFDQAVVRGKDTLIIMLEAELKLGINDTKLTEIVNKAVAYAETDFSQAGQLLFDSYLDRKVYPIATVDKPMIIGITPKNPDAIHFVYSKQSIDWKLESSNYYNQRYNITTKNFGSFLSAMASGTSNLGQTYTQGQLSLMNKYQLRDIFSSTDLTTPTRSMLNEQMIRTFARFVGADAYTDTKVFLAGKGITVPTYSSQGTLTAELANYLYVQVYAKKNQIDLNAVVVRDFNAIEDISSITTAYRNTLLKGVSLGIITLNQRQLNPKQLVTIKAFFNLVGNIE